MTSTLKKEARKTVQFTIAIKQIKTLTKDAKDTCSEALEP